MIVEDEWTDENRAELRDIVRSGAFRKVCRLLQAEVFKLDTVMNLAPGDQFAVAERQGEIRGRIAAIEFITTHAEEN